MSSSRKVLNVGKLAWMHTRLLPRSYVLVPAAQQIRVTIVKRFRSDYLARPRVMDVQTTTWRSTSKEALEVGMWASPDLQRGP